MTNMTNTTRLQPTQETKYKWATFTYTVKETLHITNIFKHTDLRIAFRTKNTIQNLLKQKNPFLDKFSSSGVYKLTCPHCHKAYIGQTGRRFFTRYNEHKSAFYSNRHTSDFAQHLHDNSHPLWPHQRHHSGITPPEERGSA